MIWGIAGFTATTVMCGFATTLADSQSVVIDEFTGTKRASALAIYSAGVSIPPTLARLIGRYVSEQISWRWVLFINPDCTSRRYRCADCDWTR